MTLRGRRGSVVGALCWSTSFVSGNGDGLAPATDEETLGPLALIAIFL